MGDKDFDIKITERLTKLEAESSNTKKEVTELSAKVEILTEIKIAITKITSLLEFQTKSIDGIHQKVDGIEEKINTKVDGLEQRIECNEEKSKIDIRTLIKDIIVTKVIPIGGLLLLGYELSKIKL